ncbi:MAG: endonuclease III, partial [Planctomycetota bacterium]
MRESQAKRQDRANKVMSELIRLYPNSKCALAYESPWQLLVATILSAQCTDARVNLVVPGLFQRFPTVQA